MTHAQPDPTARRSGASPIYAEGIMDTQQGDFRDEQTSRKYRIGRPPKGRRAMSDAQRAKAYRRRKSARGKREAAYRARQEADRLVSAATGGGTYTVHHMAIGDVTSEVLADASVDAIITDPPYLEKHLPEYSTLAELAKRVLRPYGWCVVMTGAIYLPEVIQRLGEHLKYRWLIPNFWPGGPTKCNPYEGLHQGWKPLLIYQNGDGRALGPGKSRFPMWGIDYILNKPSEYDKSAHPWQQSQSVFEKLVERFTLPGHLVVDPFAGSGTTGRAAVLMGRQFWGCDIDPECVRAAA